MSAVDRDKYKAAFRAWLDKGLPVQVARQAAIWEVEKSKILY